MSLYISYIFINIWAKEYFFKFCFGILFGSSACCHLTLAYLIPWVSIGSTLPTNLHWARKEKRGSL